MIKDSQKKLNRMHVLSDILITVVVYALAWPIVISGKVSPLDEGVLEPQIYFMALTFIMPIYLALYVSFHLYVPKRIQGWRSELANICKANVIDPMFFTFALFGLRRFVSHLSYLSTKMVLAFFATSIILLETERISIRIFLRSLRTNDYNRKHVLLIGYSRAAEELVDGVSVNPKWGYHVQGTLDDHRPVGFIYKKVQVLGPTNRLEGSLVSNALDEIAAILSIKEYPNLEQIVAACEKSGVHTKFMPDYNNIIPMVPCVEDLQGLPAIHICHVFPTGVFSATMKRTVDLVGALSGLIVSLPLMLVTTLFIKITSPGPVLFSQERIGLHNRLFKVYKFRFAGVQDPGRRHSQWTAPHGPRVTPAGRLICKTSIDEMPQFFNVLIGDMSLVRSRSERPLFVEKLREEIPRYMIKHQVRPGFTGWAQVNGYHGDTSIIKRIEYDLYCVEN